MIFDDGELVVPRLLEWVRSRPDIRAVLRTGSRARDDGFVDALSDHDIELCTTDPDRYAKSDDWVRELGPVWVTVGLEGPWENPARLGFFDGGVKIDFQVVPLSHLDKLATDGLDELHERGYEVLLDLDGLAARLPTASGAAPTGELPDAQEFHELCEEFWFEVAHIPRYLARGDLWVAKSRDWETKELLLSMIEWHALTRFGTGHDTWHLGTKMRTWAAPGVWQRFDALFGGFQADDALRAARATGELFAELAREVARVNGFPYPDEAERAILPYLSAIPTTS